MIKELITDFFNAIEEKELRKNKNAKATFWVEELQKVDYNHKNYIGVKKATRLYEKYIEEKKNISVKEPNKFLCDVMAEYLKYENYEEYKLKNESIEKITTLNKQPIRQGIKEKVWLNKIIATCGILFMFLIILMYSYTDKGSCIIWNANTFKESPCETKKAINNARYKIDIDVFKKIEVNNETTFFLYGKPTIWYGKSETGEINFFTQRGIHPSTLKELKPVTEYIINKYVLVDKDNKTVLD